MQVAEKIQSLEHLSQVELVGALDKYLGAERRLLGCFILVSMDDQWARLVGVQCGSPDECGSDHGPVSTPGRKNFFKNLERTVERHGPVDDFRPYEQRKLR